MEIRDIGVYRDGGTIMVDTDEGKYYIDRRINSFTKGDVYNDYPSRGTVVNNNDGLRKTIYESLEGYKHPFYTNVESLREYINGYII